MTAIRRLAPATAMGASEPCTYREAERRVRKDYGPQNISTLRNISQDMLKRETSRKAGIQGKRLQSGWRVDYLQ